MYDTYSESTRSNAHKLDADTIPTMIVSMAAGKAAGMKLSSESDVEKRFKGLTQKVFNLSADEAGDVYECRKNGSAESVEKTKETLSNYLGYIKIPGCVYSELPDAWSPAVQCLFDISINKWIGYSTEEKIAVLDILEAHCSEAINNVDNPLDVLKSYITRKGLGSFSDTEIEAILSALPNEAFTQTESNFKANIRKKIEELGYTKKVRALQSTWKASTQFDTITAWTETYQTPPAWVSPDLVSAFSTLRSIERNERLDITRIESAIIELQEADLSVMTDCSKIDKAFIINIASEKHVGLLLPQVSSLRKKIAQSYQDPNTWPTNIVSIRRIVEKDILNAIRAEAKQRASKMTEAQLREKVEKLLEKKAPFSIRNTVQRSHLRLNTTLFCIPVRQ